MLATVEAVTSPSPSSPPSCRGAGALIRRMLRRPPEAGEEGGRNRTPRAAAPGRLVWAPRHQRPPPITEAPMTTVTAFGADSATAPLAPLEIERREVGPADVLIEIAFCGICHS